MAKIDIFSGFLGAGKTTLIKKLISEAYQGENVVLIENEFGDIGVDGTFLQDSGIQVNEMNSGCICCSLVGDFGKALDEVVRKYNPDRILIEPSGVGKLSDVILAVENLENEKLRLNGLTTVVDANKCKIYMRNFGEFFNNQVEHAGTIILSHTSGLPQEKLDKCIELLREHNRSADIITTDWDDLSGELILKTIEKKAGIVAELENLSVEFEHRHEHEHHHEHDEHCDCGCGEHEHHHEHDGHCDCGCGGGEHHHADEVFQSVGVETGHRFDKQEIESFLDALDDTSQFGNVLRAKGIVECTDGSWIHFDYVPGEADVRRGRAATTGMLCIIGAGINEENIRKTLAL